MFTLVKHAIFDFLVTQTNRGHVSEGGRRSLIHGLRSEIKQMEGAHSFELGLVFSFGSGSLN